MKITKPKCTGKGRHFAKKMSPFCASCKKDNKVFLPSGKIHLTWGCAAWTILRRGFLAFWGEIQILILWHLRIINYVGHKGRRGYIYHTVVLPEYRRRGIASTLVEMAVNALKEEEITRFDWMYFRAMDGGKFWLDNGWEKKDFLGLYSKSITDKENIPLF